MQYTRTVNPRRQKSLARAKMQMQIRQSRKMMLSQTPPRTAQFLKAQKRKSEILASVSPLLKLLDDLATAATQVTEALQKLAEQIGQMTAGLMESMKEATMQFMHP